MIAAGLLTARRNRSLESKKKEKSGKKERKPETFKKLPEFSTREGICREWYYIGSRMRRRIVHEPNSSDDFIEFIEKVSDLHIEGLLACENQRARNLGLVLLDAKKREKFCGLIRIWSNENNWGLGGGDIAEIWEAIMTSIHRNAEECRFKKTGKLGGYVRWIAICRATDFLRRRIRIDPNAKLDSITHYDEHHETPSPKFIKTVRARFRMLAKIEKLVMTHDLRLFYGEGCKRWPSPSKLTASVNKARKAPLSVTAVRSARARGRRKLRMR